MNELLSLAESYIRFAWWQSTLVLAMTLLVSRWFRSQPWRRHLLLTVGILSAACTPAVSISYRFLGWGIFPAADGGFGIPQRVASLPDQLFYALGWCVATGGILLALMVAWGIVASGALYFRAAPLSDPGLQQMIQENARRIGRRSVPILFTSESVRGPTIWCWGLHPAVIFPPRMLEDASPEIREAIFFHELAHLQRFDHWVQLLIAFCGCLLFWNPLYWIARRRSDLYADQACDVLALYHASVEPDAYADTILEVATCNKSVSVLLSLSRKEKIMERVRNILDFGQSHPQRTPRRGLFWSCAVVGLFAATTMLMAVCQQTVIAAQPSRGVHTHLTVFKPVGDFHPKTPIELLNKLNKTLFPAKVMTGYFRTWPEKDRLIGGICTNDPEGLKNVIGKIPELEAISTEPLTDKSFAKHTKRVQESLVWTTPKGGYCYLTIFKPVGDFHPRTPIELLGKLNKTLQPARVRTGYFRTWPENDRLVGAICTDNADGLKNVLKKIPEVQWIKTDTLDAKTFAKHSERPQLSLPRKDSEFERATWAVPQYGLTHLTVFTPVGDFHPKTPIELLNKLNKTLFPAKVRTGYFRTWPENDRLVGGICTDDPDGLKEVIDKAPELKWNNTEALDAESFAKHSERAQESLRQEGSSKRTGWAVPKYGYTHLTVFTPVGDFHPKTPVELLNKLNATLFPAGVRTGYFRTWPEKERLVGGICTDDPEGLKKAIEKVPVLKWGSTKPLTADSFAEHSKRQQESLPNGQK